MLHITHVCFECRRRTSLPNYSRNIVVIIKRLEFRENSNFLVCLLFVVAIKTRHYLSGLHILEIDNKVRLNQQVIKPSILCVNSI